jgi:hypothetical protein
MAIASSGALAMSDLSTEFGGSGARSLSDYYAGDGLVASLLTDSSGNAVPSSGNPISFSDFYTCAKFVAGSFTTLTSGTATTVPTGANAIHVEFAVAGGGGGCGGGDYDSPLGESAGAGGGSGAYVSDKVIAVTAGETLTFFVGAAGTGVDISVQKAAQPAGSRENAFNSSLDQVATAGGATRIKSSASNVFIVSLTGGGGASGINGDVAGPLRTNIAGTAGSASLATATSSGTFTNSSNVGANLSTLTSGPRGAFNQSGAGAVGGNNGNCSGDNCRIGGSTGGASYAGAVGGGTGGSSSGNGTAGGAGTRGSGGGGGAAQVTFPASQGDAGSTDGGNGGAGEIKFRFIRVNA